jgi:histidine triad (HIT) family protein
MCVFCSIISQETEAEVVWQDDLSIAFLDIRPVFPGHTLLVPKEHYATLTDLPTASLEPFFRTSQILVRAVESAMGAEGTFVAMNNKVSQSVPHLHLHVVPRKRKDGLRGFFWPRHKYDDSAHMARVAADIRAAIAGEAG